MKINYTVLLNGSPVFESSKDSIKLNTMVPSDLLSKEGYYWCYFNKAHYYKYESYIKVLTPNPCKLWPRRLMDRIRKNGGAAMTECWTVNISCDAEPEEVGLHESLQINDIPIVYLDDWTCGEEDDDGALISITFRIKGPREEEYLLAEKKKGHKKPKHNNYYGGFAYLTKCRECHTIALAEDSPSCAPCIECGCQSKPGIHDDLKIGIVGKWNSEEELWELKK